MSLVLVALRKYMFLNLMQYMASRIVNVHVNALYHFGLKLEQVLFLVDRVLGVVVYMVVQILGTEQ